VGGVTTPQELRSSEDLDYGSARVPHRAKRSKRHAREPESAPVSTSTSASASASQELMLAKHSVPQTPTVVLRPTTRERPAPPPPRRSRSRSRLAMSPAVLAPSWLISVLVAVAILLSIVCLLWFVPSSQRPTLEPTTSDVTSSTGTR
jgi:cobalamin biosynthesis Mg chelatase CobN